MLPTPNRYKVVDATIANGAAVTGEIDLDWAQVCAIYMPASWTAADLAVSVSPTSGGTFQTLYDDAGTQVIIKAAQGTAVGINSAALTIAAAKYIKLHSITVGTPGTPVNQAAERTIKLICKA